MEPYISLLRTYSVLHKFAGASVNWAAHHIEMIFYSKEITFCVIEASSSFLEIFLLIIR